EHGPVSYEGAADMCRAADTGRGMQVKELAKIFEPLFTTKARGIGLGLPISRRFVKLNGGRISVQSREGSGSRFMIEFPLSNGGE
ncbi:MAG: HAMP domain-containing histidine kinase, partial [Armatimonadetes bacterium]|nr:HAMP domain-containing histidine kinase [Armatimonadota bacterium]